jgi:hypothetical protein
MSSREPDQEYAEDVTDLREAQRIIALLRCALRQPAELAYYADGEFTIFLDDRHTAMAMALFEQRRLVDGQDPERELHDVLADFVSYWLDLQWKLWRDRQEKTLGYPRGMTLCA